MKWEKTKKLNTALAIAISLGCFIGLPQIVLANEEYIDPAEQTSMSFDLEGITVEGSRPDWETKLSPGSVTVVHPDDFKGEQKTLSDLLLTVPGVHVREVNGKGQYTTVTVRGSTAAQVGIFIDGVLANLGGDSAVDLSTIPVQNVERIEVYRGYVPSRFGGTFIGGVVNIVTKRPMKSDVALELGRSSYGGRKGAMEITSPLGEGTLMVAVNYESGDGDFEYTNYAAEREVTKQIGVINANKKVLGEFNNNRILSLTNEGLISDSVRDSFIGNENAWLDYVRDTNGLRAEIYNNEIKYYDNNLTSADVRTLLQNHKFEDGSNVADAYFNKKGWLNKAEQDWNTYNTDVFTNEMRQEILKEYAKENKSSFDNVVNELVANSDPQSSTDAKDLESNIKAAEKKLKESQKAKRIRQYNDYEKTNTFVKWQSDDLVVKATYDKTDRHLPDGVWGDGDYTNAPTNNNVDLYDVYYYDSRRQIIENTGLMLQNRHSTGKLEWGWLVDYLHKDSNYRAEHIKDELIPPDYRDVPFREWSEYKSNKYNTQIDGSYKLSDRNMLDFQMNYSHERMDLDGSRLNDKIENDRLYAQTRNRYDQEVFNFQLQNSITLDKKGSWIVTPAVRYNQSKITGYSNGSRFNDKGQFEWIKPVEEQTDSKVTWQMALKKEFNEKFAMRMTGGTYYRLLNMTEIAGDGAGILPAPADENGNGAVFPLPEEGKQFDISAIMNSKFLGADNRTTLTYFWRDSENMLQLYRTGKDYWSYYNDNRGNSHGIELQSALRWSKFDLDMQITYLKAEMERKNTAANNSTGTNAYDFKDVWPTYQPEWEGNIRLTYRPSEKFSVFTEAHYTDEYFTSYIKSSEGGKDAYMTGRPVSDLFVINSGIKWQPRSNWQLTFGCNDIFDEGPKQKIRCNIAGYEPGYINPEFPVQGRTFYVTAKMDF